MNGSRGLVILLAERCTLGANLTAEEMILNERLAPCQVAYFQRRLGNQRRLGLAERRCVDLFNRAAEAETTSERESRCA